MVFDLNHWRNPRKTIANRFESNDIAYATHGGIIAMEALDAINLPFSDLKDKILLDYGCGTGRAARILSRAFKHVYAYDPVKECIDTAKTECPGINFHNITYTHNFSDIPECDMAVAINVIEHLDDNSANVMIQNLKNRVSGKSYIWYLAKKNKQILMPYMEDGWADADVSASSNFSDKMMIRGFQFKK